MAIPGHEFLTAHFSNNERTIVESYWITPDGKETRVEYIEAKPEETAWKKLLTHIDIDALHENTYKHIKEQNATFEESVIEIAKQRNLIYDIDSVKSDVYKIICSTLFKPFDSETDKEKLFMYKLQLFETEQIKSSADRQSKTELRKANSILQATKIAIKIVENNSDTTE
jgi:hypothetical protein